MAPVFRSNPHAADDRTYLFDNAEPRAGVRFTALATIFDPGTIRHLEERGVSAGWHCLEVGGGGGSIAAWLCERVGSTGSVLAIDVDTRFLEHLAHQNLQVRCHNVAFDPLPEAAFDLIHIRLVLMHLAQREQALARLVTALKPGGWLLAEDFDALSIVADPTVSPSEVALKTGIVFRQIMTERGIDLRYGRLLPGQLHAHGLVGVAAEGRIFMWQGRSAGAELSKASYEQLREAILGFGLITEQELERDLARLEETDFMMPSPIMWAAWGRRPLSEPLY